MMKYKRFQTEIIVRPDDIDLNNHVHSTKYLDYFLAARFTQMRDCYTMPIEDFVARGLNWVANVFQIEYKRSLKLNDIAIVETGIGELNGAHVKVVFRILNKQTMKIAAEGYGIFTMINLESGRSVKIPDDIIEHYSLCDPE
jgi:acyl-CoA thioester hydrolase/thioesterase-3